MFPPTKTHFTILICGALTVAGATYLHAQDKYPPPAVTPEAATQDFYQLLDSIALALNNNSRSAYPRSFWQGIGDGGASDTYYHFNLSSVSRAQFQDIEKNSGSATPLQLLSALAYQKDLPQYATRVADAQGDKTVVEITPDSSRKREVVTVAEDGGYRVDLKATYGRWNDLSGEKLDLKWFQLTNIAAPSLLNNPIFIQGRENARRSSCQSNMKQQMLGIIQYSQDYDEKLPPARSWIDAVQPYVKSEQVFICPSLQATGAKGNGYAFNQYLSQKPGFKLQDSSFNRRDLRNQQPRAQLVRAGHRPRLSPRRRLQHRVCRWTHQMVFERPGKRRQVQAEFRLMISHKEHKDRTKDTKGKKGLQL